MSRTMGSFRSRSVKNLEEKKNFHPENLSVKFTNFSKETQEMDYVVEFLDSMSHKIDRYFIKDTLDLSIPLEPLDTLVFMRVYIINPDQKQRKILGKI